MTIFNEKKAEDQGAWFKFQNSHFDSEAKKFVFDEPEPDVAEFQIRNMVPFFMERMKARKKKVEHVFNPETRAMERLSYYPDLSADEAQKEQEDAWDYAITGIKNAFFDAETPIECTRENKIKLMQIEAFDRFVAHCLRTLADSEKAEAEETEKN